MTHINLLAEVSNDTQLKRVASTNDGEYAGPCPFCGGKDRFRVWPEQGRWWCRQCNQSGDVIAYLVERGDITPREAGRLRNRNIIQEKCKAGKLREKSQSVLADAVRNPPAAWCDQVTAFVNYCQQKLFEDNNDGLEHLHWRGLTDDTIRAWDLGWHEKTRRRPAGTWGLQGKLIYLPRGVVIPWYISNGIYHVKVRLFEDWGDDTPKYIRIRGGKPTLYGLNCLEGRDTVVICEGELDAVLLHQEVGDLIDAVAIGPKNSKPAISYLFNLVSASRWLVALDTDAELESRKWCRFSKRARRIRVPYGKDVTEFYQSGGDLRAWVKSHLRAVDQ